MDFKVVATQQSEVDNGNALRWGDFCDIIVTEERVYFHNISGILDVLTTHDIDKLPNKTQKEIIHAKRQSKRSASESKP